MIYKFFKAAKGGGSAKSSVNYLCGTKMNRAGATILRGDPRLTALIADNLPFKNSYSVGCLSFEEADISDEAKNQIMDNFERALFANLDKDRYDISWVEHKDKGRLELNFIFPKVDLKTGRSITPYLTGRDTDRLAAFRDFTNIEYGLSDPNDPSKQRLARLSENLPKNKKEFVEVLNERLGEMAELGLVSSRADVIAQLESAGVKIARETNKSISIADPDGGRNIRLKGALYEQDFDLERFKSEREQSKQDFVANEQERYRAAQSTFERLVQTKQAEYQHYLEDREAKNQRSEASKSKNQGIDFAMDENPFKSSVSSELVDNYDVYNKRENKIFHDKKIFGELNEYLSAIDENLSTVCGVAYRSIEQRKSSFGGRNHELEIAITNSSEVDRAQRQHNSAATEHSNAQRQHNKSVTACNRAQKQYNVSVTRIAKSQGQYNTAVATYNQTQKQLELEQQRSRSSSYGMSM